jgi:hypothetical protein
MFNVEHALFTIFAMSSSLIFLKYKVLSIENCEEHDLYFVSIFFNK